MLGIVYIRKGGSEGPRRAITEGKLLLIEGGSGMSVGLYEVSCKLNLYSSSSYSSSERGDDGS